MAVVRTQLSRTIVNVLKDTAQFNTFLKPYTLCLKETHFTFKQTHRQNDNVR